MSIGHAVELRDVEGLGPFQSAFGEHFQLWLDQFRAVQAAKRNEDEARKALQFVGENSCTAFGAEVAKEPLAGFGNVMTRLWLAAEQSEITLRHAEEHGGLTA